MGFEDLNFNKVVDIKDNVVEREFTVENKKEVAMAWCEMVLGRKLAGQDFDCVSNAELKQFFADSLAKEMDVIVDEWQLTPNGKLIENMQTAADAGERAKFEAEYLLACQAKIHAMVDEFSKRENYSTRWDTLPLLMRENKSFNCVGASLLGQRLLERADIENYYGNPTGHVVNIARLANGDWWYADFLNGKKEVKKVIPEIRKIVGEDAIEIRDETIDYRYIPILKQFDIPCNIIGNLHSLEHEANDPMLADENPAKITAKDYLNRFNAQFSQINFGELEQKLYQKQMLVLESEEMKGERVRIDKLFSLYDDVFPAIKKKYEPEKWKMIIAEAKANINVLKEFFYSDNATNFFAISEDLGGALKEYAEKMKDLKECDIETYHIVIDKIITGIAAN